MAIASAQLAQSRLLAAVIVYHKLLSILIIAVINNTIEAIKPVVPKSLITNVFALPGVGDISLFAKESKILKIYAGVHFCVRFPFPNALIL